jgi:hypothetical protein
MGLMPAAHLNQSLLSELREQVSADLFNSATPVRLAANEVLFLAGMPAMVAMRRKRLLAGQKRGHTHAASFSRRLIGPPPLPASSRRTATVTRGKAIASGG